MGNNTNLTERENMLEKQNIEWKETWRNEYFEWISAFANSEGGKLLIGVNDAGEIVGVDDYEKLLVNLPNQIRDLLGLFCEVNHHNKEGLDYIEVIVPASSSPISYRGKFYRRSGSTTQTLNGNALQDFLLVKSNQTWDKIPLENVTINDIDMRAVENFRQSAMRTGRLPSIKNISDPETILKKLDLINDDGKYTRAAILLFGKQPTNFFTNAYLKIGKFGDSPTDLIAQDVIESNAFELAEKTIEILNAKYLVRNISYEGLSRIETPEYPFEAIREVLFNAIIHRTYITTPITIRLYDDRITIWNIGSLPEQLSAEDLKIEHNSYPRNELMANIFYKGGYIESWGRGTLKVIEECENHGLIEPLIVEKGGGVSVTIFKDIYNDKYLSNLDLNDRQKQAIIYVKGNGSITSSVYVEKFKVAKRTAIRDIDVLVELNLLKKKGLSKNTQYVINVSGYEV
ncbi:ATP-binding protein [Formosa haliotis]|uniref:ATP-binding protein n=1 Tax=Formosa haliotis TaxID=1555194 RepID=UPI0009F5659C|nr:ATP-binding protein [Formosa haliotis]